jgi:hypothetical protein
MEVVGVVVILVEVPAAVIKTDHTGLPQAEIIMLMVPYI